MTNEVGWDVCMPRSLVSKEEMTEMMRMQQVIASVLLEDVWKQISELTSSKAYSCNGEKITMRCCKRIIVCNLSLSCQLAEIS